MANTIEQSNELARSMCVSGCRYLYGAKDQSYTMELVNQLSSAYQDKIDRADALKHADKGDMAVDSSGFVCKVLGIANKSSSQLESMAVKQIEPL